MTQRAEVGFCPCCARPTHVAAPSRYMVGEFSSYSAPGIQLRWERCPWAVRYFANGFFARNSGYLPSAWDWAASKWDWVTLPGRERPDVIWWIFRRSARRYLRSFASAFTRRNGAESQTYSYLTQSCSPFSGRNSEPSLPPANSTQLLGGLVQAGPSSASTRRFPTPRRIQGC